MSTSTAAAERRIGDVHIAIRGEGAPLLLIHGNSGDLHFFDRNLPLLASHRKVVAMDCRGQGLSARGHGPLTLSRFADDAAEVIRALGTGTDARPERFAVLGFSDGANVAMLLAARHPELVESLVLASGNATVSGLRLGVRFVLWVMRLATELVPASAQVRGRRREQLRLMLDSPGIRMSDLRHITAPALVLAGQHDLIRQSHTRMLAETIPHARLLIVRGGSHTVLRDRADTVTPLIVDFLAEPGPRADGDVPPAPARS